MTYEQTKISPEMIEYYEEERNAWEGRVKDGILTKETFADGTALYKLLLSTGEVGLAVSVNGLIIRSGDMVKMKQFSRLSKIINDDPRENIKDITVGNFATNYYNNGIDFSHRPFYSGDNMKLTEIAENLTAIERQQKQARFRQKQMAVSG